MRLPRRRRDPGDRPGSEERAGRARRLTRPCRPGRCGCASGGNTNAPVRVDSKGDGGDVTSRTGSTPTRRPSNAERDQAGRRPGQGGHGVRLPRLETASRRSARSRRAGRRRSRCSAALQLGASNSNTPVAVGGSGPRRENDCGCGHREATGRSTQEATAADVDQSNRVDSDATAANLNATQQDADQDGGSGIQAIGQSAHNAQFGLALQPRRCSSASGTGQGKEGAIRADGTGPGGPARPARPSSRH